MVAAASSTDAPLGEMSIRPVNDEDIDALVALWSRVFPEYNDPKYPQREPRANIVRKLAQRDGLFWLAQHAGNVLGSVMAGYDGHRGWVYSLGVHPDARRAGLGAALLNHVEEALRAQGCVKLNMQVMATNESALAFYATQGYAQDNVVSIGKRL
jgi:ribosomal protein S18 acetylase RimI-like enzyme